MVCNMELFDLSKFAETCVETEGRVQDRNECRTHKLRRKLHSNPVSKFNYNLLDEDVVSSVLGYLQEIKSLKKGDKYKAKVDSPEVTFRLGNLLLEVKELLPHGFFLDWLHYEVPFNYRTSQCALSVATHLDERFYRPLEMSRSSLYLLAQPSRPQILRDYVLLVYRLGELLGFSDIKELADYLSGNSDKVSYPLAFGKVTVSHLLKLLPSSSSRLSKKSPNSRFFSLVQQLPEVANQELKPLRFGDMAYQFQIQRSNPLCYVYNGNLSSFIQESGYFSCFLESYFNYCDLSKALSLTQDDLKFLFVSFIGDSGFPLSSSLSIDSFEGEALLKDIASVSLFHGVQTSVASNFYDSLSYPVDLCDFLDSFISDARKKIIGDAKATSYELIMIVDRIPYVSFLADIGHFPITFFVCEPDPLCFEESLNFLSKETDATLSHFSFLD